MDSVPRRTRRQWDEYYKNQYNELKKKNSQESGGKSETGKLLRKAVDSENIVADRNGGKSVEDVGSSRSRRPRTAAGKRVDEEKEDISASEKTRKLDTRGKSGDCVSMSDDDFIFLGEQVVSNGSSLKTGHVSGSGSASKADPLDAAVSSVTKKAGGRPGEDDKQMHHDVNVYSGNSVESSDGSDDSSESESESTSEVDDEFSDEDYEAGASSASEASSGMNSNGDSEQEEDDDNDDDDHVENMSNAVEGKRTFSRDKKSTRRESGAEEESDEGTRISKERDTLERETCDGSSGRNKDEDVIITSRREKNEKVDAKCDSILKKRNLFEFEVFSDGEEMNLAKCLGSNKVSEFNERESKLGKHNFQAESASSPDYEYDSSHYFDRVATRGKQFSMKNEKFGLKKPGAASKLDLIKILVDSINAHKDTHIRVEKDALLQTGLPSRFWFEDEVVPPQEKSECEKEIDSLFRDLELGLRESETDCTNFSSMENDQLKTTDINETPAARCGRGEHQAILDEEIGIVCSYCHSVILEIKYVLPPFHTPSSCTRETRDCDELDGSFMGPIQFPGSACRSYDACTRGTVWELIPGIERGMFPHQREGFEFVWKNIAGDIIIEKLKEKQTLSDGQGCIISHAPGTGKTRLTIVFLRTFLKLYPTCCPMIIAPRGMLLTWESEFIKWGFDSPFHNLNKKELSGNEYAVASQIFGQVGAGIMSTEVVRLLKLYSWTKGGGILGISYQLFEKLAGENGKDGLHEKIREVLLERPGILVLDEGHTPRNDRSLIWKALSKVATHRRIILSGTPFQNNLMELFNTLCLVNPKFVDLFNPGNGTSCRTEDTVARKRWTVLTSSIGKNKDQGLKNLKEMLDPFVHVHKGNILQESIPGLRHTLVFLHPTEYQKSLLETSSKVTSIFRRIRLVSLVSVHPSLHAVTKKGHSIDKSKVEEIELDADAGVKIKFLMKLIWLADALKERVLVFSQFIDPLLFIKKQIEAQLSWIEGRELLYMDGQLDANQRQESILSFNDETSRAKVLLASERACSEGINLIGASRVVLLDTVWNPSVEKQAISRAYRLGQKKVVHVYRLFTSGIEVRQFAQQINKVRLSELIFSPGSEQTSQSEHSPLVLEDKLLESMLNLERFNGIFERIICQPKESDLIEIFGLSKQK